MKQRNFVNLKKKIETLSKEADELALKAERCDSNES